MHDMLVHDISADTELSSHCVTKLPTILWNRTFLQGLETLDTPLHTTLGFIPPAKTSRCVTETSKRRHKRYSDSLFSHDVSPQNTVFTLCHCCPTVPIWSRYRNQQRSSMTRRIRLQSTSALRAHRGRRGHPRRRHLARRRRPRRRQRRLGCRHPPPP